jgi:hypothetical protein
MQNPRINNDNVLCTKVEINLNKLGVLMLNYKLFHIDIITIYRDHILAVVKDRKTQLQQYHDLYIIIY